MSVIRNRDVASIGVGICDRRFRHGLHGHKGPAVLQSAAKKVSSATTTLSNVRGVRGFDTWHLRSHVVLSARVSVAAIRDEYAGSLADVCRRGGYITAEPTPQRPPVRV